MFLFSSLFLSWRVSDIVNVSPEHCKCVSCTYVFMYVRIYVHTYIHTHIHTYTVCLTLKMCPLNIVSVSLGQGTLALVPFLSLFPSLPQTLFISRTLFLLSRTLFLLCVLVWHCVSVCARVLRERACV